MLLTGKTAVISGAASARGIGRATARLFAEHGARVAILDLDRAGVSEAAASLPSEEHIGLACDVTNLKGIPLNRLGEAADVAGACLFPASDLSSCLTGATIDVNGGMLIHG